MRKIALALSLIISLNSLAVCDWKSIKETSKGFLYPKDCHVKVGKLVKTEKLYKEQIGSLNKRIELKDLQVSKQEAITDKWRKTSYSLEDRVIKSYKLSSFSNKLNFAGGFVLAIISVWAVGQIKTK